MEIVNGELVCICVEVRFLQNGFVFVMEVTLSKSMNSGTHLLIKPLNRFIYLCM